MSLSKSLVILLLSVTALGCDSAPERPLTPQERLVGTWILVRVDENATTGTITRTGEFERRVGEVTITFEELLSASGGQYTLKIDAQDNEHDRTIRSSYTVATIRGEGNWGLTMKGPDFSEPYLWPGFHFDGREVLILTLEARASTASLQEWADLDFNYDAPLKWKLLRK